MAARRQGPPRAPARPPHRPAHSRQHAAGGTHPLAAGLRRELGPAVRGGAAAHVQANQVAQHRALVAARLPGQRVLARGQLRQALHLRRASLCVMWWQAGVGGLWVHSRAGGSSFPAWLRGHRALALTLALAPPTTRPRRTARATCWRARHPRWVRTRCRVYGSSTGWYQSGTSSPMLTGARVTLLRQGPDGQRVAGEGRGWRRRSGASERPACRSQEQEGAAPPPPPPRPTAVPPPSPSPPREPPSSHAATRRSQAPAACIASSATAAGQNQPTSSAQSPTPVARTGQRRPPRASCRARPRCSRTGRRIWRSRRATRPAAPCRR